PPAGKLAARGVSADALERSLAPAATGEAHQRELRAGALERPPNIVEGVQLAAREVKTCGVRPGCRPPARGKARLARPGLARWARPELEAARGVQRQPRG